MKSSITVAKGKRVVAGGMLAMAASLFLAGCVVTSVYPFYTEKDLVFDPSLLGEWVDASATNTPNEFIRISQLGEKGYAVTAVGEKETSCGDFYLFRLKDYLFADKCATNRSLDYLPVHQVSKVQRLDTVVETANLNYDWLSNLIEKNPKAIRHTVVHDKPGDNGRIVLTADTKELQRFILKHINNTNAWNETSTIRRRH